MKNKKLFMYIIIVLLILFILIIGIIIIKNNDDKNKKIFEEYVPEQEITDEQFRTTNILLYFYNKNIEKIEPEIRKIDSKNLLENPENQLIEYLISGPQSENLEKLIPEKTKLINTKVEDGILIINFSNDFILNQELGIDKEMKIIDSILKTAIQLNEINGIKILIEGQENMEFPDHKVNFKNIFKI